MEILTIILHCVELVAIICLIFVSKHYFPSYLKEKGKNLATKEDISDITSQIERVKVEYLKEAEEFKLSLSKELELLKISHTSLQANKVQYFSELIDHLNNIHNDFKKLRKPSNKAKLKGYQKKTTELFAKLFLFASDDTIKKWVVIRSAPKTEQVQKSLFLLFADFILSLRKDIGYNDTECNVNDVVHLLYTSSDWEKIK